MMQHRVLGLTFLGLVTIWAAPSMADGAIAVGDSVRSRGLFSWGASVNEGRNEVQDSAERICRGDDPNYQGPKANSTEAQRRCSVVGIFYEQCVAMAWNGSPNSTARVTGYGWAIAGDSYTAKNQALASCEAMRAGRGPRCAISGFLCDGSAR